MEIYSLLPLRFITLLAVVSLLLLSCAENSEPKVLVFYKTSGWVHESIPYGIKAIQELGMENEFLVDTTKDASYFSDERLRQYAAVIFLSTSEEVLNSDQQVAFMRYIQAGGGFVGIHGAADTEYDWPWFNKLIGAYFLSHPNNPNVRSAAVDVVDSSHVSMKGLPKRWERVDEWYNFKNIDPTIKKLANLDESSYEGGENGVDHPIAWYHEFDGGRSFYTGGGHTNESYSEPLFRRHILGGIRYAIGNNVKLDYSKSYAVAIPEDNRFSKTVLANDLNEPMQLAIAPDGRVFFVERNGNFYQYNPKTGSTDLLRRFPVMRDNKEGEGNGMLGITIDPNFSHNNFIYFFYTPDARPARQNVSRFVIDQKGVLDLNSEKVIIQIPIDLEKSAHTGSSMDWDKDGNLFISTGDNTNPFESEGYAPIDDRPGRLVFDAQRSSANANDLRGKILRIHPQDDGTYIIPEGNLFKKGIPGTRPEIYIMGCRNPYRISVDSATGILYWGDIGPDAGKDGEQGPKGYDEFNQAKAPGNYGWPYFVGNNSAYQQYSFDTKKTGALFKPEEPKNKSPNNTGIQTLPPAKAAMVWYPYELSDDFPVLGQGGRSAIAGPVYHFDTALASNVNFPRYFDKGVFIFDWMRNWVYVMRMDSEQNFLRLEPFMSTNGDFRRPIHMKFGADGILYALEYGSVYGVDNFDARLVKIEYIGGNRAPVANISAGPLHGHAPLTVDFFGHKCRDFDGDALTYEWTMDGKKFTDKKFKYTFQNDGVYPVVLTVQDDHGLTNSDTVEVKVGNTPPEVTIATKHNKTFFFPNDNLEYEVAVHDDEDKVFQPSKVAVEVRYISNANPLKIGHQNLRQFDLGKQLLQSSDCKACHQINLKSVGPAFLEVSKRYKNRNEQMVEKLADKIITGGSGVWGAHAMNAHPQLSKEDAKEIVRYVLSLNENRKTYPPKGLVSFEAHNPSNSYARFVIAASYTDDGGTAKPLDGENTIILRPSRVEAEYSDRIADIWNGGSNLTGINEGAYFMLRKIDLAEISKIGFHYSAKEEGSVEVHSGGIAGPVVSKVVFAQTGKGQYSDVTGAIEDPGKIADLYFVFHGQSVKEGGILTVDWIEFIK